MKYSLYWSNHTISKWYMIYVSTFVIKQILNNNAHAVQRFNFRDARSEGRVLCMFEASLEPGSWRQNNWANKKNQFARSARRNQSPWGRIVSLQKTKKLKPCCFFRVQYWNIAMASLIKSSNMVKRFPTNLSYLSWWFILVYVLFILA